MKIPIQLFRTADNKAIIYCDMKFIELLQKMGVLSQTEPTDDEKKKWGSVQWGKPKEPLKDESKKPLKLGEMKVS